MFFSGLRGAIAFALALQCHNLKTPNSNEIVTCTLVIVIFTVLVFGGLSYPLLKILKLDKKATESQDNGPVCSFLIV